MTATAPSIFMLADRPDLAVGWAELHWYEWGAEPGRDQLSWWVNDALRAVRRDGVPAAFVAVGDDGTVLGGVGLHEYDLDERRGRSPWVVGTIVRPDRRGQGIGQALMARLQVWAAGVGIEQVWVATEHAAAFYERCGFERVERLRPLRGEPVTILTRRLSSWG